MHNGMWSNWMYGCGMGWGWLGFIFMIVFWGLVILGIIYLAKAIAGRGAASLREETPLDILKKRYARGEIDQEEFIKRKRDLES